MSASREAISISPPPPSTIQLTENDVIINPGTIDQDHPGNASHQRIINLNRGSFKSATDKSERLRIAKAIVHSIHESKGRFLERSNGADGGWKEANSSEAIRMTIFALRGVTPIPVKVEEVIDITDEGDDVKQEVVDEAGSSLLTKSVAESDNANNPLAVQQTISMGQLIKLEADQTTYSKYPVGCRVYYNFNTRTAPMATQPNMKFIASLCVGSVDTVFMDLASKGFVYKVGSELLRDTQLSYATGTPVHVQFGENNAVHDGEIMSCNVSEMKKYSVILFTGNNDAQIFDGVTEDKIRYRHVEKESAEAKDCSAGKRKEPAMPSTSDRTEEASKTPSKSLPTSEKPPAIISTPPKKRAASSSISSITHDIDENKDKSSSERPTKLQKSVQLNKSSAPTRPAQSPSKASASNQPAKSPTKYSNGSRSSFTISPRTESNHQIQTGSQSVASEGASNQRPSNKLPHRGGGSITSHNYEQHLPPSCRDGERFGNHPYRTGLPTKRNADQLSSDRSGVSSTRPNMEKHHVRPRLPAARPSNVHPPNGPLIVDIPSWLQNTPEIRQDLFHHLMGQNPVMETGYKIKTLAFQTNCAIRIRGPEFGCRAHKELSSRMHVTINAKHGNDPPSDQMRAKQVIEESICDFVGDDGSKGRLYYDLAASSERDKCHESKSNAVFQWNPFVKSDFKVCMTVLALPFRTITHPNGTVSKNFHGGFLLKSRVLVHIAKATRCRIYLCGDQYKTPTKLCDPYVLVCGDGPVNVDHAVDILRDNISQHQGSCDCTFDE